MRKSLIILSVLSVTLFSQQLRVDSVAVDTIWNSDSSWYNGQGIFQQRQSRDCYLSFIPVGEGMVQCSVSMTENGGNLTPNPLFVLENGTSVPLQCGIKTRIKIRVLGEDRENVVFKVTCRQRKPVYLKSLDKFLLGDTVWVRWNNNYVNGFVATCSLSTGNPEHPGYYPLEVIERRAQEVKVVFSNADFDVRETHPYSAARFSKIKLSGAIGSVIIDSFKLQAILATKVVKPHGGDTIMLGDVVKISWRCDPVKFEGSSVILEVAPGDGAYYCISPYAGQITDQQPFLWVVGHESREDSREDITYENGATVKLFMYNYTGDEYHDKLQFTFIDAQ